MPNSFLHHHLPTALAATPARSVQIGGRTYPASQRNLVAASLLVRPERPVRGATREMSWPRP